LSYARARHEPENSGFYRGSDGMGAREGRL
jgi:hypothetical protein